MAFILLMMIRGLAGIIHKHNEYLNFELFLRIRTMINDIKVGEKIIVFAIEDIFPGKTTYCYVSNLYYP